MAVSKTVAVVIFIFLVPSEGGTALESEFSTLGVVADRRILAVSVFPFELPPVVLYLVKAELCCRIRGFSLCIGVSTVHLSMLQMSLKAAHGRPSCSMPGRVVRAFGSMCCGIANDSFISLVRRWGRDVHCIVGVLGRLTTRHELVISCNGAGRSVSVVHRTPKRPFGRLLCETNHASLTNQCLTAPAMCTVPDPSPQSIALHRLSSLRPATVTR